MIMHHGSVKHITMWMCHSDKNIFSEYVDILTTIVTILNNEGCIAGSNCSSYQTLLNGEKVLV